MFWLYLKIHSCPNCICVNVKIPALGYKSVIYPVRDEGHSGRLILENLYCLLFADLPSLSSRTELVPLNIEFNIDV